MVRSPAGYNSDLPKKNIYFIATAGFSKLTGQHFSNKKYVP